MSRRYDEARYAYEDAAKRAQKAMGLAHVAIPHDITGGFVLEDYAWRLLRNPTKNEAAKTYEALLDHAQTSGWDDGGEGRFLIEETGDE